LLTDVTIIVPTFHRRGYLEDCLTRIADNLPECPVVIASDDDSPALLLRKNTVWVNLPYDSGLTAKRNAAVYEVRTKYTLVGSDDFDFRNLEARESIAEMTDVLNGCPKIDVVVGQVNSRDYQGRLEYVPGEYIKEHRLNMATELPFDLKPYPVWRIDIGVNFFLARTDVLREIPWDESIRPIGGEHADWFLDLKTANKVVVFLPFANICAMPYDASKQHHCYREMRNRAYLGHELMMKKRNIKRYYGFDEEVK